MVGEECDAGWLAGHLATAGGSDESGVLVLDCRSLAEYRAGHIVGAIHLMIPTLMLRRLRTGCLPVEAVINCQDARDRFSRHWKTKTVVLSAASSSSTNTEAPSSLMGGGGGGGGSDLVVGGRCVCDAGEGEEGEGVKGSMSNVGVVSLLYHRLKEDGCKVTYLRGGFAAFNLLHPELCVASQDNETTTILGLGCLRLADSAGSSVSSGSTGVDSAAAGAGPNNDPASPDNSCHFPVEVLPNLYLGNAKNSADFESLHKNGIRYILNVTPNVPNMFENNDQFQYHQIPICDHWSQNMTTYFPQAIAFIEEARRKKCGVLVHCLAGISRSVTITVAYLMHSHSLSLNDAYDHVKRCKPNISPNFNFMGQLLDYERALRLQRDPDGVAPPSECGCQTPVSADSGAEDLSTTSSSASCACVDRLAPFSSPASSTLSSLSTGATSSSSSSSSAFSYEIPPSSQT